MTIHTTLVAEQSSTLRALVSGDMIEAKSGTAVWEDVEEETFAQFAQFVYTGDYPPSCRLIETSSEDSPIEQPKAEPLQDVSALSFADEPEEPMELLYEVTKEDSNPNKTKKKTSRQPISRNRFQNLTYEVPSLSKLTEECKICTNQSSADDYTPVFLGHARLYVLAEKWGIEPLKSLVLHKLHATLLEYTPYEARYGDVVELIRYTYENTPCRKSMSGLRELVTKYVAHEIRQIAESEPCLSLVEDNGSFARDLLSTILASTGLVEC